MINIQQRLHRKGILAQGSAELQLYENRLTRYFSREYQALERYPSSNAGPVIPTNQGPMWDQTKSLMDEHFDASITLFRSFLDERYLAYTMAYYGDNPASIIRSQATLEQAQQAKFRLISHRAEITGNERIFNLGCGFAPLETYFAEHHPNCTFTSITPSQVQSDFIEQCKGDPSHPLRDSKLKLIRGDFGAADINALGAESYDLVFAVGAFEHINNLELAFAKIFRLLKPGGRLFIHLIVSKPLFPQYHDSSKTLIGRFFPGGHIWPKSVIESQTDRFKLERSWYLNGFNYWRTLDAWHQRYWRAMDQLHDNMLNETQIRHWNDYFVLCKVVLFAPCEGDIYGNGHFLFRKPA